MRPRGSVLRKKQVRRDHAISHVLASLSRDAAGDLIFFGGTALSRTHLTRARLSEDIDLIAKGPRHAVATKVAQVVESGLLRSHGRITWTPPFGSKDVEPAILRTQDNIAIRVQVLDGRDYEPWPVEWHDIEQRYVDAAPARLLVPTVEAFVGWKTAAWFERRAARDSYHLWALSDNGSLTPRAAEVFVQHGPTAAHPSRSCSTNRQANRNGSHNSPHKPGSTSSPRRLSTSFVTHGPPP